MANLIIKPTSGGNLILQDEGGDAALTVGTSGVSTIANASITTGTIAAATNFPAGHVLQQVSTLYEPGNSNVSTTSTNFVASAFFLTITPTNAANDICMCSHINGLVSASTSANAIVEIQRSINGGSYARMGGSNTHGMVHTYAQYAGSTGLVFTDTNFSTWTTGAIIYKLYFRTDNGSHTCTFLRAQTSNCAWALEIKR